jgi:hypothetical protein
MDQAGRCEVSKRVPVARAERSETIQRPKIKLAPARILGVPIFLKQVLTHVEALP